ncbi:SulP family inorganic anion transporter [Bacillus velezensis]|uniref:SulP family inorganic anion transporter n=1 Tax=Bacillus velezensis TaxID=492670 RepID=UPI003F8D1D04
MQFTGRYQGYNLQKFQKDLIAGIVVGIVAIPLGMAFAIASGVGPEYGLYTVIVAGILISLLGGSKYQIGGPTGAFVPILFAIVMQYGFENLLVAGFMAGVMLVLFGVFKLGKIMKFVPKPVIVGFTAGIAVLIFSEQIAHFLGLRDIQKHESFILNIAEIGKKIGTFNLYSILIAGRSRLPIFSVCAISKSMKALSSTLRKSARRSEPLICTASSSRELLWPFCCYQPG